MKKINKHKIIIAFLILGLILPASPLGKPKEAEAAFKFVKEIGANLVVNTITKVTTGLQWTKENIGDAIAKGIAKLLLRRLTMSIVDWINRGFEGSPTFITNYKDFLTGAGDEAAGLFLEGFLGAETWEALCSPFRANLYLSLPIYRVPYEAKVRCTLNDVIENFEENFAAYQNDFMAGGWQAFLTVSQNTQNNPMGLYLETASAIEERRIAALNSAKLEAQAGKGFIGIKTCLEREEYEGPEGTVELGECRRWKTNTPGSAIADVLGNSVFGSSFRELELADEINEIVSAALNQLIAYALSVTSGSEGVLGQAQGTVPPPPPPPPPPMLSQDETENEYLDKLLNELIPDQSGYLIAKIISYIITAGNTSSISTSDAIILDIINEFTDEIAINPVTDSELEQGASDILDGLKQHILAILEELETASCVDPAGLSAGLSLSTVLEHQAHYENVQAGLETAVTAGAHFLGYLESLEADINDLLVQINTQTSEISDEQSGGADINSLNDLSNDLSSIYYEIEHELEHQIGPITDAQLQADDLYDKRAGYETALSECETNPSSTPSLPEIPAQETETGF